MSAVINNASQVFLLQTQSVNEEVGDVSLGENMKNSIMITLVMGTLHSGWIQTFVRLW